MKFPSLYALCVAALLAPGCHPKLPEIPQAPPPPSPHRAAPIQVGVARADVTVPPGAATFGHGLDARAADGFWTRTYCRAFYFQSATGEKLALVPCELPAMSALLQRQVSQQVRDILHASQIVLTAVHTHAGVGHYFGAAQYTSFFSSRLPGYDDDLMHELARRIAAAIRQANDNKKPAQLKWQHKRDFWCFTHNRSLAAYQLNRPAYVAGVAPECADRPDLRAIDPAIDVLRIDYDAAAAGGLHGPIGSLSFFAMHPTVVHHSNQLFGGDVAGVISRDIERELRQQRCAALGSGAACTLEREPLHGVLNTNEGDISPNWSKGDIEEAVDLGRKIAAHVWKSHPTPDAASATAVLDSRYIEEDIREARFSENAQDYQNCPYAQIGQGAARGGGDHPTSIAPLAAFGSESPADFSDSCCHSPKRPLLGLISLTTRGSGSFPSDLPLSVAQVEDTLIAFVPAELTLTAGFRVRQRIKSELEGFPDAPKHVVLAGLANEYIQYVTTEEEYQLQAYEGASTLYGPNSSKYLANRLGLLARSMFDPRAAQSLAELGLELGVAKKIDFGFGPSVPRLARKTDDQRPSSLLATCRMPDSLKSPWPPRVCMYWQGRGPGDIQLTKEPNRPGEPHRPAEPWIRIVTSDVERKPIQLCHGTLQACDPLGIDDRGYEFQTRVHQELAKGWLWSTLFSPRPETWRELAQTGARIQVDGSPAIESASFSESCLPPRCSVREARLCTAGARTDQWKGLVPDE